MTAGAFRRRGRNRGCSRTPRVPDYRLFQQRIGTRRVVVVTPAAYVTDNAVTLDAIAQLGPQARGVAVVHPTVTDAELKRMDDGGIRGIRFTQFDPNTATTTMDMIEPLARRVQPLGWHVQIHLRADQIVAAADLLLRLPGTVVFDHLGRLTPPEGLNHPAFGVIRRMLDGGRTWMKLSGAYLFGGPPAYAEAAQGRAGLYRGRAGAHGVGQRLAASDRERKARRRGAVRSAGRLGAGRSHTPAHPGREPGEALRISGSNSRTRAAKRCIQMERALLRAVAVSGRGRLCAQLNPAAPPSARGSCAPSSVPFGWITTAPA